MPMKILFLPFFLLLLTASCQNNPQYWEFSYPGDDFSGEAMLDLSYLNEETAGETGFIGLDEEGESFLRGDGRPIRFWSANTTGGGTESRDELKQHAKFLAKMGVNMARYHGSINPRKNQSGITDIDTAEVDAIWKWHAAMREEGIYTTISPFWANNWHMGEPDLGNWGLEGFSGNDDLWGAMYFYDELKEAYKGWVKYLYTGINPYTGIALKDDPALAIIQVKNEDGLFFWTMQNINPVFKRKVMDKFTLWAVSKYGSYNKALAAWNGLSLEGDIKNQLFDIFSTWEMTQKPDDDRQLRMTDQVEFYFEVQYDFYREIHDYYREVLGCPQLINPNNWKTADVARLNDLERLSYTSCEVPAVNRYYAPGHRGENSGWRIDPGHFYEGISALKDPVKIPVNIKQTKAQPMLVTESGWNSPHKYQSEAPLLISSFMSLTGVDSYYWFFLDDTDLDEDPYFTWIQSEDGMHPMKRWSYSIPGGVFMFPANALLFRSGYVRQGQVVVNEKRTHEQIFRREIPAIAEENSYDPNRDSEFSYSDETVEDKVNPLAFLVGPVVTDLSADRPELIVSSELSGLIDEEESTVSSITGEMELNYSKGIFRLDTPRAKALSGFLSEDVSFVLDGLMVKSIDEYATIVLVSMDGKDLEDSEKILVQAGTVFQPTGWQEEPDEIESDGNKIKGFRILNTGKMPWLGRSLHMHIELLNSEVSKAFQLDAAGYPVKEIDLRRRSDVISMDLPYDCMYLILTK